MIYENSNEVEILLVEDNPPDAELAIRTLKKNKLANNLVWVKDGEEALNFLFGEGNYKDRDISQKPKVVLLDLRLPKVDGIEVLQKIKNDSRTKSIPVVILTSSKEEVDIVRSYDSGVNSYISKPVEFDNFVKVISDLGMYWLVINHSPEVK